MGHFKGKWAVEEYGPRLVKHTAELSYTTDKGITHTVEEGFISDGGSIPKVAWSFIGSPFVGYYRKSVAVHDKLYATQRDDEGNKITRKYADRTFIESMRDEGVSWWKRNTMCRFVRLGAYFIWKKHAKKLKAEGLFKGKDI